MTVLSKNMKAKGKELHDLGFFITHNTNTTVRIHPLAVTTILDAFDRRPSEESRAVGTIVGFLSEGAVIDIVDAFAVTHSDNADTVLLDQDYHRRMVGLRKSVRDLDMISSFKE
jgi:translation initiation factor 3 subunit F